MQLILHLDWKIERSFPKQVWDYYISKLWLKKYSPSFLMKNYNQEENLQITYIWTGAKKNVILNSNLAKTCIERFGYVVFTF